ncbi:MAG: hypothetical protein A3K09_03595 [Nitrospinae bacterium RIFCSPLOWO2_12_FULL_47_7]|nr:MAG: hypothetical protein A3K09_03595 [Nitrospinae bacterium RIFCSPLOWO2_12_FULL_47_7]
MEDVNKNKHDLLMHLLSEGDAMLCLDARAPGVSVPPQHKTNPKLSLIINLNFKRPIEVTLEGVTATLAFSGRTHSCVLPFTAVWAIYEPHTMKGQVWEENIPKDANLMEQALKQAPEQTTRSSTKTKKSGWLKEPDESKPKRDRSHLRVIK